MYVTRPLSEYKKYPETLRIKPEGPNSGTLVIRDEESVTYTCFGSCEDSYVEDLPFPHNVDLEIGYGSDSDDVDFIPVINQPLSSKRYYAIKPHRTHKGEAYTSSRDEDKQPCCFGSYIIEDVKPKPLDPHDMYQQYEISTYKSKRSFHAKSVNLDGHPPNFLRRKGWSLRCKPSKSYQLGEASGLNASLIKVLPDFNIPVSRKMPQAITLGKWYCPFMFIREGKLKDQRKRSKFYVMTLERKWERIFSCQNSYTEDQNSIYVDVDIEREEVFVGGQKGVRMNSNGVDGVIWFRDVSGDDGERSRVGLRVEIVERMKWEQEEKIGWLGGNIDENQVKVQRVEEYSQGGFSGYSWRQFGFYVLVDSFVLKRMDGSVVLSYNFTHIDQVQSKWE